MSTYFSTKAQSDSARRWLVVDASGKAVGRLASEVAAILRGKHKTTFSTYQDVGDFVVVINAAKVRLTGSKPEKKVYYHYTGFIGGTKMKVAKDMLAENPERVITRAVQGMLPAGALGSRMLTKLRIYAGAEHPHKSQKAEKFELKYCVSA